METTECERGGRVAAEGDSEAWGWEWGLFMENTDKGRVQGWTWLLQHMKKAAEIEVRACLDLGEN